MARYSRIRQGRQLQQALTNYTTYITTPRTPNVNSRGARGATISVYVTPFGLDIGSTQVAAARNNAEAYTVLSPIINAAGTGGLIENTIGSNTRANLSQFRPARVVWFRNAQRSVSVATSEITGTRYLKYAGQTSACAFGRGSASDDMVDVFNGIKDEIFLRNPTLEVNRISLTREQIAL